METWGIDYIVESLVSGNMGVDDFMQAVQDDIEAREASTAATPAQATRP